MKKSIITALIVVATVAAHAQTKQVTLTVSESDTALVVPKAIVNEAKQVLTFSFQYLPSSSAKGSDITAVQDAIKQVYPFLVPKAPTGLPITPASKTGK